MRELIILGTGNAMVTKYYNTCFLIKQKEGNFLVDAGGGNKILSILEEEKLSWNDLHHMFLTHTHTDHILGAVWIIRKIASLIVKNKYQGIFNIYAHDEAISTLTQIAKLTLKKKDFAEIGKNIIFCEVKDGDKLNFLGTNWTFFD